MLPGNITRTWLSLVERLLWGSDGSAAGGGRSDLSEWPRSVCNAAAPTARRTLGTATGGEAEDAAGWFKIFLIQYPDVAQFGRALALGARCRRFESCRPDHLAEGYRKGSLRLNALYGRFVCGILRTKQVACFGGNGVLLLYAQVLHILLSVL